MQSRPNENKDPGPWPSTPNLRDDEEASEHRHNLKTAGLNFKARAMRKKNLLEVNPTSVIFLLSVKPDRESNPHHEFPIHYPNQNSSFYHQNLKTGHKGE